jgi:membrane protease YdiL (CAAX protease family)
VLHRLICGHPLVAYFAIAYVGTWLVFAPLLLGRDGLGLLPYKIGDAAILLVFLSAFTGPTLGALSVTAVTSGKAGVHRFLRRYIQWRAGVRWYLLALFSFFAIFLLSVCIPLGLGPLATFVKQWQLVFTTFVPLVIVFSLSDALGEEPGWRGFALPRLQKRYGPVVGTVVLGTLHSFWHLPTGFVNGGALYPFGWVTFVTFMLTGIAGTFIYTWIYNHVKGSILIAILIHAASNASTAVVSAALPAHPSLGPVASFLFHYNGDLVIGFGVVAVLLVVCTRGRLGYHAAENASLIYEDLQPAAQSPMPAQRAQ